VNCVLVAVGVAQRSMEELLDLEPRFSIERRGQNRKVLEKDEEGILARSQHQSEIGSRVNGRSVEHGR